MIGNNVSQQWVITRDDHGHPEVYVEVDVNTSQPLGSSAYALLMEATRHLGDLALVIRRVEPAAAPETVDVRDIGIDTELVRQLRNDLRDLADRVNAVSLNGVEPVFDLAHELTKKYDL